MGSSKSFNYIKIRIMNVNEEKLNLEIDPYLTPETLNSLFSHVFNKQLSIDKIQILTGGCWNRIVSVSFRDHIDDIVIKINPDNKNNEIKKEFNTLNYFSLYTNMKVPKPIHYDNSEKYIPGSLLIMTKIPGKVMHQCSEYLTREDRENITIKIAESLAKLHLKKGKGFGNVSLKQNELQKNWPDFWLPKFDEVFNNLTNSNLVETEFLKKISHVRSKFDKLLDIGETSTLTHYDIWSGNIIINLTNTPPEVSGFVDVPGNWADYARELSFAELFGIANPLFYEVYSAHHKLDEHFQLRKNIYNLKMTTKHIMMYPNESFYRKEAEDNLDFINRNI